MAANLVFSAMRPADLAEVMEIERLVFASPWTPGLFLHELQLEFSRTELARLGSAGPLAGYVVWWRVADEAHILNIAVDPARRRRGIGAALTRRVVDDAAARRAATVSLDVRAGNLPAQGLYKALGFAPIGRRKGYYDDGEDAVIMSLTLPPVVDDRAGGLP
jgi:ribosomal-protein-alanine N-acetyltransferase